MVHFEPHQSHSPRKYEALLWSVFYEVNKIKLSASTATCIRILTIDFAIYWVPDAYDQRRRTADPPMSAPRGRSPITRKMVAIYDYNPRELSPNVDVEVMHNIPSLSACMLAVTCIDFSIVVTLVY
jgi:hypothetical protein